MIIFITFLYLASSCNARPNPDINIQNVVTVPPNCPNGWTWINGACREIWSVTAAPNNVITVPPNCPPGQSFINGQCRDVWIDPLIDESNLRKIQADYAEFAPQKVVTVPSNCRPGQLWLNGSCLDVWRSGTGSKNVITVPTNCPSGQEFIKGQCREVWKSSQNRQNIINGLNIFFKGGAERQIENYELPDQSGANRNVITVPSQCPAGYRPDILGNCRPIFYN